MWAHENVDMCPYHLLLLSVLLCMGGGGANFFCKVILRQKCQLVTFSMQLVELDQWTDRLASNQKVVGSIPTFDLRFSFRFLLSLLDLMLARAPGC